MFIFHFIQYCQNLMMPSFLLLENCNWKLDFDYFAIIKRLCFRLMWFVSCLFRKFFCVFLNTSFHTFIKNIHSEIFCHAYFLFE